MTTRTKRPALTIEEDASDSNDLSSGPAPVPQGINLEEDAAHPPVSKDMLGAVGKLGEQLALVNRKVAFYEEKLAEAKAERERLLADDLPTAMDSCGLKEFKLSDGTQVLVDQIVAGSIPEKNRVEAFRWLRENGHGGLVKNVVSVALGKGQDALAQDAVATLRKMGLTVEQKESVHAQTLSAWARECLKKGMEFPRDLLGIYVGRRATVKQSRPNKETSNGNR